MLAFQQPLQRLFGDHIDRDVRGIQDFPVVLCQSRVQIPELILLGCGFKRKLRDTPTSILFRVRCECDLIWVHMKQRIQEVCI